MQNFGKPSLPLRAWAVVCADRYSPVEFWWHDPQVQALNLTQRNFYLQSGVDPVDLDQHFYGVHGDWETRRLFSGFGYKHVKDQSSDYEEQFVQLGIMPYLSDYGDLHIWLMLKCKKNTLLGSWSTYPLIRLFKGNVFAELGYSDQFQWDAHLMYRFSSAPEGLRARLP